MTSCCFYLRNLTVTQVYVAPLPFFVNCLTSIVILHLYKSRNPSLSHRSPLMRSQRLPQNKNNAVLYGSSCNCAFTIIASPSIERLRLVYPVTMYTCLSNDRSFSIIHVLMQAKYLLRYLPEVIFASHFSQYEYLRSLFGQLQALLQVQT